VYSFEYYLFAFLKLPFCPFSLKYLLNSTLSLSLSFPRRIALYRIAWHRINSSDYHRVIANPMDLGTLLHLLQAGSLHGGAQEFLDLALSIFQNAIDYNSMHQGTNVQTWQHCTLEFVVSVLVHFPLHWSDFSG
jgi:hypothetical protein